ncbi:hypothetical protein LOAG_11926 [Loa loa]|uniref:Uncharacterized protein n=1 Tax=Loa loa TaxID=7209 RepID=A0A1I7VII9_LOALO|nr:hypothetical protein LOAG_11926 [Loa loa]EFO16580.1 hypothetical protein LOAG_11926 [Loa loa]
MIRTRRESCGCNQLEQMQSWIGELCICIPKSSTFSMSCSCPQVQQQLQQSNRCGCNLHGYIGQQCQTGCQQSCNTQCNPYMPQMHCNNACLMACMQSCNLQQQQYQHHQLSNLPYWNPNIYSLQQSYPNSHQQLLPITEQCLICLIGCEQLCIIQQSVSDSNRLQCGCMQQCQQSCSSSMQSQHLYQHQQCIPHCQQNCQQFCNQQMSNNQQCQPQCKQQCINICIISPESQFASQINPFNYPNIFSHSSFSPQFTQLQYCFANCFDSCNQSCGQHCSIPCTQNCQQFCHHYHHQQQQQSASVVQQVKQPQVIRVDLNAAMLESMQCIPQCQQTCLQQCNINIIIKPQCQPACQTICQQNCGHQHQLLRQQQQQQQQQQLTQCQQTAMIHCYCTNGNIPCNNGSQCCKKR